MVSQTSIQFDAVVCRCYVIFLKKMQDYGAGWGIMRTSSMTDLILMKLLRIKQIEDNQGETLVSEGVEANYHDIINYAVFALIKMEDERS